MYSSKKLNTDFPPITSKKMAVKQLPDPKYEETSDFGEREELHGWENISHAS